MTNLGYDKPLYLMAFDHRGSFEKGLFGATRPISAAVHAGIVDTKNLIYEAFVRAVEDGAPRAAAGVLVDEEYGVAVARAATDAGFALAMPVERSGQDEFDFEYGDEVRLAHRGVRPHVREGSRALQPGRRRGDERSPDRAAAPAQRLAA